MSSTSPFPKLPLFFRFSDPLATQPYRLQLLPRADILTFEQVCDLASGLLALDEPLIFKAGRGGKATDVLWAYDVLIYFFSEPLRRLLTEAGVSGWTTYPVELYDRKGNHLPGYQGIAVTGPKCRRDRSRSSIVDKPPPVPGGRGYQVYRGLYFDESQWDGSDMFWVSEGGGIVVTEKLYRLFRRHKIRNVELTPLTEVEIDVSNDKYGESARKSG
jgi:hypothetical protein